jgi:hypothetical protein
MNYLEKLKATARAVRLPRLTPAAVYNLSLLVGLALVAAGVDQGAGRAVALVTLGALVLGFAVFERLLLFRRSGR